MKKTLLFISVLFLVFSCHKDKNNAPTTGILKGTITDKSTGNGLSDVRIIVFDANTNAPTGGSYLSDASGNYNIELDPGTYFLKLSRSGYNTIPEPGISAIPITVEVGQDVTNDFALTVSDIQNGGVISGKTLADSTGLGGVLVVAEGTDQSFSTVSDGKGNYYIYNVAPGNYSIKGWIAGFNSSEQTANVTQNSTLSNMDLSLKNNATATVTGMISFLATTNIEVDVSLVNPATKETVPGLNTMTSGGTYSISNVPDGLYLGRASYENDKDVMDPDWIVKNGEPEVTISGGANAVLNFSVTNAVTLISPTNDSTSVIPVDVSLDTLNFKWQPYASSNDYVIEVSDVDGNVIWGGFSSDWSTKNITIPSSTTSVKYNSDGKALEPLEAGKIYRWRIYASKNDRQSATGWRLISVSEDQMGLIKIAE